MFVLPTGPAARAALAAAAALLAVLAIATPARAHNRFVGSMPEAGATVTEPRPTITLEFSENIDERFTEIAVIGPDGQTVEIGEPAAFGSTVSAEARFTASGEHTIGYRVMSDDGHPVEDEITFTVELPAEPDGPALDETANPATRAETGEEAGAAWVPTALAFGGIVLVGALALFLPRRR